MFRLTLAMMMLSQMTTKAAPAPTGTSQFILLLPH